MGIVGGPAINTGFLDAGLLDEISILMGAGIDARREMPSVFDGLRHGSSAGTSEAYKCAEI